MQTPRTASLPARGMPAPPMAPSPPRPPAPAVRSPRGSPAHPQSVPIAGALGSASRQSSVPALQGQAAARPPPVPLGRPPRHSGPSAAPRKQSHILFCTFEHITHDAVFQKPGMTSALFIACYFCFTAKVSAPERGRGRQPAAVEESEDFSIPHPCMPGRKLYFIPDNEHMIVSG